MATQQQQPGAIIFQRLRRTRPELANIIYQYLHDWYFEDQEYDQDHESVLLLVYQSPNNWTFPSISEVTTRAEKPGVGQYFNYHFNKFIPLPDVHSSFPYFNWEYKIYQLEFQDPSTVAEDETDYDFDYTLYNWEA